MVWGRLGRAEDLSQLSANPSKKDTEMVYKKAGSHKVTELQNPISTIQDIAISVVLPGDPNNVK